MGVVLWGIIGGAIIHPVPYSNGESTGKATEGGMEGHEEGRSRLDPLVHDSNRLQIMFEVEHMSFKVFEGEHIIRIFKGCLQSIAPPGQDTRRLEGSWKEAGRKLEGSWKEG
jgi:hypothetical protein